MGQYDDIPDRVQAIERLRGPGRMGVKGVVLLMPMAILGRQRPTSTTASIDPNFGAVHRWGEDVLERFSPEYYKTYLNPKRKAQKPDVDRLWRYFKQLAIDSDERRQDRTTTEAERVQVLVRFL
ncbi:hypothetical protein JCM10449v2_005320 [Rhodotorula kratochvilovae]